MLLISFENEIPSPDRRANPGVSNAIFYRKERATKGSSFSGIVKKELLRGIEEDSGTSS